MEKGINYATNELKLKMCNMISEAKLPAVNIHYILMDILNEVLTLESQQVQKEKSEYEKILNKENKGD